MRFHRSLAHWMIEAAVRGFNRNPWTTQDLELVVRKPRHPYRYDGLITYHNHDFMEDPEFRRVYGRAVQAAGWDYEIFWRFHVMLWAATLASAAEGCFIECGTGRGFMASGICEHLGWTDRRFLLFDTFDPRRVWPHLENPLEDAPAWPYYATSVAAVRENFREWPGVELVVGRVPETLSTVDTGPVAFLHVDMNHPTPEEAALRHFWPRLSAGGVVVFDDYAYDGFELLRASADAVAEELGFSIVGLPTGQGIAIKTPFAVERRP
jgi:hypothetical protein